MARGDSGRGVRSSLTGTCLGRMGLATVGGVLGDRAPIFSLCCGGEVEVDWSRKGYDLGTIIVHVSFVLTHTRADQGWSRGWGVTLVGGQAELVTLLLERDWMDGLWS